MKLPDDDERREIDRRAKNMSWGLLVLIMLLIVAFVAGGVIAVKSIGDLRWGARP